MFAVAMKELSVSGIRFKEGQEDTKDNACFFITRVLFILRMFNN